MSGSLATIDQSTEHIGNMVGRYKLPEQIGEGGMGVVIVAEPRSRFVAGSLSSSSSQA